MRGRATREKREARERIGHGGPGPGRGPSFGTIRTGVERVALHVEPLLHDARHAERVAEGMHFARARLGRHHAIGVISSLVVPDRGRIDGVRPGGVPRLGIAAVDAVQDIRPGGVPLARDAMERAAAGADVLAPGAVLAPRDRICVEANFGAFDLGIGRKVLLLEVERQQPAADTVVRGADHERVLGGRDHGLPLEDGRGPAVDDLADEDVPVLCVAEGAAG